jgi:dephospho-CoA kinase
MRSQVSREERLAHGDCVVDNNGDRDELAAEIERCWAWITSLTP